MSIHGDLKRRMRADVHKTFALPALYRDATMGAPVDVTIRWHSRVDEFGDLAEQHFAKIVDNVDRIIFDSAELVEKGITPRQHGTVTITEDGWRDAKLVLQVSEPTVGPVENAWQVGRGAK